MAGMNSSGYRLLGYAVWNGGKWYLRRRLPSTRVLALSALLAGSATTAAAVLIRRAAS